MLKTTQQDNNMEKILQRLAKHPWLPQDLLAFATEVTRLHMEVTEKLEGRPDGPISQDSLAPKTAHRQGQPLLDPADFPCDIAGATALWERLLRLAESMDGPMGHAARVVRQSMQRADGLRPEAAFVALMGDEAVFFDHWEKALPEAPAMARFLAQASLTPWLVDVSRRLVPHGMPAEVWTFGHCPHCGQAPLMGYLRDKEGRRWHICAFCRLSYRTPRLQCPICLESDAHKLRFFTTVDEPGYEVHVCESCKNYIKLRNLRAMDNSTLPSPLLAALDDLDSLPLDLAARQQGYVRSTFSAWGF